MLKLSLPYRSFLGLTFSSAFLGSGASLAAVAFAQGEQAPSGAQAAAQEDEPLDDEFFDDELFDDELFDDELFDDGLDALLGGGGFDDDPVEGGPDASALTGWKGFIELLPRIYFNDRGQDRNDEQLILEGEMEFDFRLGESTTAYFRPRIFMDVLDGDNDRFEPYELYVTETGDGWDLRAGQFVENWGIADTYNPIDVINRRDLATGVLDNATVRAMNGPKNDRKIDIVRANMERWRWLPRELGAKQLGDAYVILNIPDYTLKLMHNGKQVWTTRVVVGKPGKQATPELTETMKYITVNPTWNVPPSIIYNEYLPALAQDPTVLDRMGLKLAHAADGSVRISQPPGEANALGRIRFNFPNKFLVYQHDTPDKHLFAKEERAFSHGCMRVQNPDQYAANLLSIALPKEGYTPEKIKALYGRSELNINFPTPIPVNITYQTAFVDDAGKLEFRKDIYGRDARVISLLKGSEGKEMEMAVSHAQPNYVRPTNVRVPGDSFASNSGMGFFERLFGAPTPPAPVRGQRRVVR